MISPSFAKLVRAKWLLSHHWTWWNGRWQWLRRRHDLQDGGDLKQSSHRKKAGSCPQAQSAVVRKSCSRSRIALWRASKCFSNACIMTEAPCMILLAITSSLGKKIMFACFLFSSVGVCWVGGKWLGELENVPAGCNKGVLLGCLEEARSMCICRLDLLWPWLLTRIPTSMSRSSPESESTPVSQTTRLRLPLVMLEWTAQVRQLLEWAKLVLRHRDDRMARDTDGKGSWIIDATWGLSIQVSLQAKWAPKQSRQGAGSAGQRAGREVELRQRQPTSQIGISVDDYFLRHVAQALIVWSTLLGCDTCLMGACAQPRLNLTHLIIIVYSNIYLWSQEVCNNIYRDTG